MGKKKWCFGREDVICMTKDCKYMSECIQVVWEKKMGRLMRRSRDEQPGSTLDKLKSKLKKEERARKKHRSVTSNS